MNSTSKGKATRILSFLKPSAINLIFIAEWALLVLFELLRGELSGSGLGVALLPLAFFYLVGSLLAELSRRTQWILSGYRLGLLALSLTLVDQAIKTAVSILLPYQASMPLVDGWLYIAHERNLSGSWLVQTFDLGFVSTTMLTILTVVFLLAALFYHRRYLTRHRKSVWADAAFLGFTAALLSWLVDMLGRGYILDYIQVPGIVTADLKDVLLTVAIASIFTEIYDNPELSLLSW